MNPTTPTPTTNSLPAPQVDFAPPTAPAAVAVKTVDTSRWANPSRFRAAGIITIVEGSLVGFFGMAILAMSQSTLGAAADSLSGGALTMTGLFVLLIGGGLLTAGIGAVKLRGWGRIATLVANGLGLLGSLFGLGGDGGKGGAVFMIILFATTCYLAYTGGKEADRNTAVAA